MIPPGLDDRDARRWLLVAIGRKREQVRRDGGVPSPSLAAFAAWLASADVTVTSVEAARLEHRRRLSRESSQRYRARLRAERDSAA